METLRISSFRGFKEQLLQKKVRTRDQLTECNDMRSDYKIGVSGECFEATQKSVHQYKIMLMQFMRAYAPV